MNGNLNFRKKKLDAVKSALHFNTVRDYALRWRAHLKSFFKKSGNAVKSALNWKNLDFSARKIHIEKLIRHQLAFDGKNYNVKISFRANDAKTAGTLGSTNGAEINIYDQLVQSDNHDTVVDVCTHEPSHVKQINDGSTTLSHDDVKTCAQNYVSPYECYETYRNIAIEQEAFQLGRTVCKDFTAKLRQKFYTDQYQRAA